MKMYKTTKSSPRESVDMPVEMMCPSITLDDTQLPEIASWRVGEEYYLLLKVKEAGAYVDHENNIRANFDVLEAGAYEYKE